MCKCANVSIIALPNLIWVVLTELRLIFLWMVKVLDTVMGLDAVVTAWALQPLSVSDGADF